MKQKFLFIPFLFMLFSLPSFGQLLSNGSFEEVDCEFPSTCLGLYFHDNCITDWKNGNRAPRVLENDCVFNAFETPFGNQMLQMNGSSWGEEFLFHRYGDALFQDVEMLNCQSFELTFWAKTHYLDAWVGLEFYAVETMEEETDPFDTNPLNMAPLKLIDLTGGFDVQLPYDEWQEVTVTLDLNNTPHPFTQAPATKYNHLLIVAKHYGWGQVPAVVYLDNFSMTPCEFDSEATIYHNLDDDCGYVNFILDCDLENVKSFIWDFGDGSELLQTDSPDITHLFQFAGEYDVNLTIINNDGCIDELTAKIKVSCDRCTGINADFEFELLSQTELIELDPETGKGVVVGYYCKYQFSDLSSPSNGSTVLSWDWDFGDGSTSSLQNPIKHFYSGNTYDVCFTVEDTNNCTATICKEFETCNGRIAVPNDSKELRRAPIDDEVEVWKVFPNPFQESLQVGSSAIDQAKNKTYKVFNIAGEEVFNTQSDQTDAMILDLQNLTKGIYILIVLDSDGELLHKEKVVKF